MLMRRRCGARGSACTCDARPPSQRLQRARRRIEHRDRRRYRRRTAAVVGGHAQRLDPDLFLPQPERIITSSRKWKGDIQGGRPLYEHFGWSLFRVFFAFALACVTAIPVGIAMGVRASHAASSIRRSSSTVRCRRLRICR